MCHSCRCPAYAFRTHACDLPPAPPVPADLTFFLRCGGTCQTQRLEHYHCGSKSDQDLPFSVAQVCRHRLPHTLCVHPRLRNRNAGPCGSLPTRLRG